MKGVLRPYQKKMFKLPKKTTQFRTAEGRLTLQGCGALHFLVIAWLDSKPKGKWVLACPICKFYEELLEVKA